jgi:hypothetical protein
LKPRRRIAAPDQSEESSVRSRTLSRRYRKKGHSTIIEEDPDDVSMKDVLSEEDEKPKRTARKKDYKEDYFEEEEFSDEEDFDTVSKVLRPSGVTKEKVQYENEYDEACSKL